MWHNRQPGPKRFAPCAATGRQEALRVTACAWFRDAHHHGFWPQQLAGLGSAPDRRTRRALLHLSYSCASPVLMTMLVTHDPMQKCRQPQTGSLAHVNLWHAIGIAGETHFLARQFCQASQARAGLREQVFHRHR